MAAKKVSSGKRSKATKKSASSLASMSPEMVTLLIWTFTLLSILFFILAVVRYA